MGKIGKTFALLLTLIIATSCLTILMVKPANAQTIPKPSVPEFTLKYVDNSYDVPLTYTYSTDPYTGKEVKTPHGGNHVDNKTIDITIRNQPFTPYNDSEGNIINLSYNVRFKGHFGESGWIEPFYQPIRNGEYGFTAQHPQSNSEYTQISVPSEFQVGDVVDFQIQKLEGYYTSWEPMLAIVMGTSQFTGETSDWSSTQTITIGQTSTSASPNPTPTPTSPTTSTPTTTSTTTSTPTTPDTNSNPTNLIILPLEVFVIIVAAVVSLAVALSVLLYTRHRKIPLPL